MGAHVFSTHLPTPVLLCKSQFPPPPEDIMNRIVLFACLVAAAAAIDCYTCKSGGKDNWQNTGCPPNGNLTGWAAGNVKSCDNSCATVVKKWPAGNVVRGCSDVFKFQLEVIPTTGCRDVDGNYVCFCDSDQCNTDDMTAIVNPE